MRMRYGASLSTATITSDAGMLPILPCSVRSITASSPTLLMNLSSPGCPANDRPQRTSHSLKPSSQPRPPRSCRLMWLGWTTSFTGESQPKRTSPIVTSSTLIPRVGITRNCSLPLSTSIRSTPSCLPPCRVRLLIDQRASPLWPGRSALVSCQLSACVSRLALVKT